MVDHRIQNANQYGILIADDIPDGLVFLNRILEGRGYSGAGGAH
jgi:hypothetical protein